VYSRADWAAQHLSCGPVGPTSRWAATSEVDVGQTTYPVNRGDKEARDKVTKRRRGQKGEEPLDRDGDGLYLDICVGVPEFLVTPLLIASVCLLS